MTDDSIFDLGNTSDISPEYVKQLKISETKEETYSGLIFKLFDIKDTLTLSEMMIGFFRQHKIERDRKWFNSVIYSLVKKNLVHKVAGTNSTFRKTYVATDRLSD